MPANAQLILAVTVFLVTYAIIVSERIHRTIISLVGAFVLVACGVLTHEMAIAAIDFNVVGLLVGMMLIVGLSKDSGVFEFAAISLAKLAGGRPLLIMVVLSLLTALLSGFLNNVTLIMLAVPVTITIAELLEIDPVPMVLSEVILSNVGGTATLIGDPPNLLIGSAARLGFMDFVVNLGPVLLVIAVVTIVIIGLLYRKRLQVSAASRQRLMEMDPAGHLKDPRLARQSLAVLGLTMVGFVTHQLFDLESATVAMLGASLLLLVVRPDADEVFNHVEWSVIFFFIGLFILIGSIEAVGVIEWLAVKVVELTGGQLAPASMAILWVSAIASAFIDNIPLTATMIPVIKSLGQLGAFANLDPLWWSLALGACLGGNGTLVGASANVVASGLLEDSDHPISFLGFMALGFPLMLLSIAISSAYLYLRYLL